MCNCNNIFCDNGSICGNWPYNRPFYNPPFSVPFNRQCAPIVPPVLPAPCPTCSPCTPKGCLQNIITDCVLTTQTYPCIGIAAGANLTAVLGNLNTIICNLTPPNCGTWTALPLTALGSASTIGLPLFLPTGSFTTILTSPPQYSVDGCGNVSLRGFVEQVLQLASADILEFTSMFDARVSVGGGAFAILPVGSRPKSPLVIPAFIEMQYGVVTISPWTTSIVKGWIFVNTDGNLFFGVSTTNGGQFPSGENILIFNFSIDSVRFSIN